MMQFDVAIIGGGLSSLVCGISLQREGKKCVIVSAGQNALHFSSGTFSLLNYDSEGKVVLEPLAQIPALPADHPYAKIGPERAAAYAAGVKEFFASCGVSLHGDALRNSFRMTATGTVKPAWLAMEEVGLLPSDDAVFGSKALIVNLAGFLDFNTAFIADALEGKGVSCRMEAVSPDAVARLRRSHSEMRSVNIARVLDRPAVRDEFVKAVLALLQDEDVVILPDVFGLADEAAVKAVREAIPVKVVFAPTMPPSIGGIRTQMKLKDSFVREGGVFLQGDVATGAEFGDGGVASISTANLCDEKICAGAFVLASGGFFGQGLQAVPDKIFEPVLGLDVEYSPDRASWYDKDFFAKQNYIAYGVRTDSSFRAFKDGKVVPNLYVCGSELAGAQSLSEGSGSGVAILSALAVAGEITGKGGR